MQKIGLSLLCLWAFTTSAFAHEPSPRAIATKMRDYTKSYLNPHNRPVHQLPNGPVRSKLDFSSDHFAGFTAWDKKQRIHGLVRYYPGGSLSAQVRRMEEKINGKWVPVDESEIPWQ